MIVTFQKSHVKIRGKTINTHILTRLLECDYHGRWSCPVVTQSLVPGERRAEPGTVSVDGEASGLVLGPVWAVPPGRAAAVTAH